jgi:hypothetical protein
LYFRATLNTLWGDAGLLRRHGTQLLKVIKRLCREEEPDGDGEGRELLTPSGNRGRRRREGTEEDEEEEQEPEEEEEEGWDGGQRWGSGAKRGWGRRLTCPVGGTGGLKQRLPAEETPEEARRKGKLVYKRSTHIVHRSHNQRVFAYIYAYKVMVRFYAHTHICEMHTMRAEGVVGTSGCSCIRGCSCMQTRFERALKGKRPHH